MLGRLQIPMLERPASTRPSLPSICAWQFADHFDSGSAFHVRQSPEIRESFGWHRKGLLELFGRPRTFDGHQTSAKSRNTWRRRDEAYENRPFDRLSRGL